MGRATQPANGHVEPGAKADQSQHHPIEETRLLRTVPDRLRDLVVFVLDTGARRSEAFGLTWDRVDLARKPRPVVYFTETKTGEHRCVPLPKRTARMLRRRKKKQGHRSKLVFAYEAERDIYTNQGKLYARRGQMIPMSNFQTHWRRLREKVGNVDIRMHDLRHTYASKLVARGVPLADVGKLLGHRTMESTMRYAYLAIDQLDRAVSVLDK
jgi:integrase